MIGSCAVSGSSRSRWQTSGPVSRGIIQSSSSRSGLSSCTAASPVSPSASAKASKPAFASLNVNMSRMSGSSSTSRMRAITPEFDRLAVL